MTTINIMTPLTRPINIDRMYSSMWHLWPDFHLRWIVVADDDKDPDVESRLAVTNPLIEIVAGHHKQPSTGHAQRNYALDHLTIPGYVYWLDDDNVIHPLFFGKLRRFERQGWKGMLFGQHRAKDGYVSPDLRHIDTGQIVVHTSLIGDTRWGLYYTADGDFIREVYAKDPDAFIFVDEVATYHNRLRRGD